MKCGLPLIFILTLVAQAVAAVVSPMGPAVQQSDLGARTGVLASGEKFSAEKTAVGPARPVAVRSGRGREEVPLSAIREALREPPYSRRFARHVEVLACGLKPSAEGLVWSLTAVHRAQAELRAARGRQSDP